MTVDCDYSDKSQEYSTYKRILEPLDGRKYSYYEITGYPGPRLGSKIKEV